MQRPEGDSLSFWQDEAQIAPRYSALEGQVHADVAVIGGGITGVACALWLARDDQRVILLERETVAHGASGRNGGFLLCGTVETYDRAIALYGHERARRLYAFSVANNVMVRALIDELEARRWPTGYRHTGSLRLADAPEELVEIRAATRLLTEDGWPTEVFDETRLPKRLRGHYMGGSFHPGDGEVQPAKLVSGLAKLALEAGAIIYEQTPALSLQESSDGVIIQTPAGTVHAEKVILATNAWLDDLLLPQPAARQRCRRDSAKGQQWLHRDTHTRPDAGNGSHRRAAVRLPDLRALRLSILAAVAGWAAARRRLARSGARQRPARPHPGAHRPRAAAA